MLDKKRIIALGAQHVLAMYAGAMIVPLIIGGALKLTPTQMAYLLAADMFTCGIATLIQVLGTKFIGIRLPVVLGCSFTAVIPAIAIGTSYNLVTVFGSVILAGLVLFLIAPLYGKILRLFPKVVTGSVVTIIGLSLVPVAMNDAAGGPGSPDFGRPANLLLSLGTLVIILLTQRYFKGFMKSLSVLLGLFVGTVAGYALGMVKLSPVSKASWFNIVHPFYFGRPELHLAAILTMIVVCLVSTIESIGVYFALSRMAERELSHGDIIRGLRAEGLAIMLGGSFNTFPYATFAQNVGLVSLTRVTNRSVIVAAGIILVILGSLPKLAALATIIPAAVLGGAMIAMFGMVVASGLNTLATVDLRKNENMLIVACSISVGLGSTVVPQMFGHLPTTFQILAQNGIVTGAITAVLLNLFFNRRVRNEVGAMQEVASEG